MNEDASLTCPWCSAVAPTGSTTCPDCGAAIAQRESLGDVSIPGVTAVHPGLQDAADRPLRIAGPSPTQGAASGTIFAAAVIGGPVGLAAIGGVAALAAAEYAGAGSGSGAPADLEGVGRPSEVALKALKNMERAEAGEPAAAATDVPPDSAPDEPAGRDPASDPWRDLPPARG